VSLSLRGFFLPELLLAEKPWQSPNSYIIKHICQEIATTCKQEEKQEVQVSQ
jgi:hypothetical protein